LTRKQSAAAAAVLASVCVFAAIAVSVVNARRPLDERVAKSFGSTASQLTRGGATVAPHGCRKQRVDFYDCSAVVSARRQLRSVTLRYRLWLRADQCWSATRLPPFPSAADSRRLRLRVDPLEGCLVG
jgi:hypothetical protein